MIDLIHITPFGHLDNIHYCTFNIKTKKSIIY